MLVPLADPLHVVLVSPQIPPNTGNVARLCAVTGCRLSLVDPLGFSIDDRHLKRAGLDYWDKLNVLRHPSYDEYRAAFPEARRWLFSARAERSLYEVDFREGDHLAFGSETHGLPASIVEAERDRLVTIPMLPQRRSLNLSASVAIAVYEGLRQLGDRAGTASGAPHGGGSGAAPR